ncbi:hypothetical protein PROFUN_10159 [Planoprotostelium fungivorum]|uniref:Uncharacterized protein n=1 Tax=Planoprotostelium fungivorum TaxID=1890364 RepID=A0A2P6NEJ7_9EUKA|nr:hypothetical protein PROFUN_10159 [Planoprotostelium fungivorum]
MHQWNPLGPALWTIVTFSGRPGCWGTSTNLTNIFKMRMLKNLIVRIFRYLFVYCSIAIDLWDIYVHSILSIFLFVRPLPYIKTERSAILITGVSSGIGRYLAHQFAYRGYTVFGTVRNAKDAQKFESDISDLKTKGGKAYGHLHAVVMDVTDKEQCRAAVNSIEARLKRDDLHLHALINNAGFFADVPIALSTDEFKEKMMDINFHGPARLVQLFLPLLTKVKGSRIVNIGSVASFVSGPLLGVYGASKAALRSYSEALNIEYAKLGVSVSHINTGSIDTRMMNQWKDRKPLSQSPYTNVDENDSDTPLYKDMQQLTDQARDMVEYSSGLLYQSEQASCRRVERRLKGSWPLPHYYAGFDSKILRTLCSIMPDNLRVTLTGRQHK